MAYSKTTLPMQSGNIYHVYSRGVGQIPIFKEGKDYTHFLKVVEKKLVPLTEIYAYCLMPNHYHLMLKVIAEPILLSRAFSEMGVSYSKWFNIKYDRSGSLFTSPFKRRALNNEKEIGWLPWYIHRNPLHHGFVTDWASYPWSSYQAYISGKPTKITTSFLLDFYGGVPAFKRYHEANAALWHGESFE